MKLLKVSVMSAFLMSCGLNSENNSQVSSVGERCISKNTNGVFSEEGNDGVLKVQTQYFGSGPYSYDKPSKIVLVANTGEGEEIELDITEKSMLSVVHGRFLTTYKGTIDADRLVDGSTPSFKFETITNGEKVTYPETGWYKHTIPYGTCSK